MKRIIVLISSALSILIFMQCSRISNNDNSINNEYLTLIMDSESRVIRVKASSTDNWVIDNVLLEGDFESFQIEDQNDSVFGVGNSMVIIMKDGGEYKFTLFESQPFLFVTPTIINNAANTTDINKLIPLSFSINLGKPARQIKTLGTGGLLAPEENPGSYVYLTTVDPESRNGVVTGWLTNEKGSGVLFSDTVNNQVEIKAQIDYGHYLVASGKKETIETLLIGYFDDARIGQELFADALAKFNNIKLRERSAVYCTWYDEKHGGAGSESSCIELAKYINKNLKDYGLGVIQIDDQWQDGGSYNGPARGFDCPREIPLKGAVINGTAKQGFPAGYPKGMETTATAIQANGLTAGIWWMPFARNHQDPEYAKRQHWFAIRKNGHPFETAWGGTSLDLTHPEVLQHIEDLSKTMYNWGFNYFKMDGLWTGTVTEQVYINDGYKNDSIGNCKLLYNPAITQIEAFRNGLKTIRRATKNEVFLSGCCISQNMRSFGPSIGLVDAMRIGPDFNHDGESIRTGAIRASRLYFLNGRVWWNDPDPSMLRESGESSADPSAKGIGSLIRARLLPSYVAVSKQFFLSSDWIPDLPAQRIEIMKRCMASHTGSARPVDAFSKFLPSIWLATGDNSGTERNVIGLFNWETKPNTIGCTLEWAGLNAKNSYYAFDFWENKPLPETINSISAELPSESCQILALRAKAKHPVVVSTSQHVTQGMIDLVNEKWDKNTLSGTSKLIGGDLYELRIAGLNDGGIWSLDKATTNGNTTIDVLPSTEKGWLRVVIQSDKSATVNWEIKFRDEEL